METCFQHFLDDLYLSLPPIFQAVRGQKCSIYLGVAIWFHQVTQTRINFNKLHAVHLSMLSEYQKSILRTNGCCICATVA